MLGFMGCYLGPIQAKKGEVMKYNYRHIAFHIIGLAIIAAFIAYPVIRFGLDALESTAIVFF